MVLFKEKREIRNYFYPTLLILINDLIGTLSESSSPFLSTRTVTTRGFAPFFLHTLIASVIVAPLVITSSTITTVLFLILAKL